KKISVVELCLSSEISYQDLAIREGISNTSMIANWVNRFHAACPDALKSCKKGRKNTLDKPKIDIKAQEAEERKLKDLLSYTGMPKATYMYRQKRFDRKNPDKEIKDKILEIRETHKDYGYRRVVGELRNKGYCVNKKKVQHIIQKLGLQVTSFIRKSRKYSSYKGKVRTIPSNRIRRRFNTYIPHQKITTDTTEFKYYDINAKGHMTMHKLYPDSFMDMCNGEIISYEIDKHSSAKNVMDALEQAIDITSDCKYRRTFH
ncbi:MAG: IS3 family transposase, partial [Lachnoanaerobaculum sp.]|nr:IS3 family transposase [Lachnoanaerobaculum sp.]